MTLKPRSNPDFYVGRNLIAYVGCYDFYFTPVATPLEFRFVAIPTFNSRAIVADSVEGFMINISRAGNRGEISAEDADQLRVIATTLGDEQ